MLKTLLRYIIVACIAVAFGFLIYHLNQSAGTASIGSGADTFGRISHELGSEGGFWESGAGLSRGLFGIAQDLVLISVVTFVVVSIRKAVVRQPKPARTL